MRRSQMRTSIRGRRMKNDRLIKLILSTFIYVFFFGGCSGVYYKVKVNGYSNVDANFSPDKIFLIGKTFSENPLLLDEVQFKIQNALTKKGVVPTQNLEEADHVLYFSFGIDTDPPNSHPQVSSYTTQGTRLNIFTGQLEPTTETHVESSSGTKSLFTRFLIFNLYEAKLVKGLMSQDDNLNIVQKGILEKLKPLWIGEVYSSGTGSDLRSVIDYLIYAGFEHFGENTGKQIPHVYLKDDEDVKNLIKNPTATNK